MITISAQPGMLPYGKQLLITHFNFSAKNSWFAFQWYDELWGILRCLVRAKMLY